MAKHTKGPWRATLSIPAHGRFPAVWQIDDWQDAICTTQFCYARETEANARLIASAPEMLDALIECEDHFDRYADAEILADGSMVPTREMTLLTLVRAAIAKATGT